MSDDPNLAAEPHASADNTAQRARQRSTWAPKGPPSLFVLLGWQLAIAAFIMGCVLVALEILFISDNPYFTLVTYTLTPLGITAGLGMVAIGTFRRWLRYRRGEDVSLHRLPNLDLNVRKVRLTLLAIGVGIVVFVCMSGVATYRGYHFTESTEFCGTVCHQVMEPEYAAHKYSPHARVGCASCHIGPGADWYVRSKLSGMRQVYNAVFESYELPIKTPLEQLRPARDTCEQCHWPSKFEGSIERVLWRFWYDRHNTASRYHLLMKVGGVNPGSGRPEGIHWHSSSKDTVRYWARDFERQDIPWVEVEHADGGRTVYQDGSLKEAPPRTELRKMDCIDCHNRPAHRFPEPATLVDHALAEGALDRTIPYLKRNAVQALSGTYESRSGARESIRRMFETRYPSGGPVSAERRDAALETLVALNERYSFPEQGVSWRVYVDNGGHKSAPGCFRCHAGEHRAESGEVISHACDGCHDFIHQAHGDTAFGPVSYVNEPFEHPGHEVQGADDRLCSECHSPAVDWYPGNARPQIERGPNSGAPPNESAQASDSAADGTPHPPSEPVR